MLVLEKNTGKVRRVVNGVVTTVLDLAVNFGSERGLLGIALHPDFPTNRGVYLFWTESTTGSDTDVLSETPLLGNRVDRFLWNGSTLTLDRNLIRLRAIQQDIMTVTNSFGTFTQSERGNHDGGVIGSDPTASCTSSSATPAAAASSRTSRPGPLRLDSGRPSRTTSSAAPSPTTRTSQA